MLIVNTNSGGHAVIGFYFAKELLGSGHQVTVMTVGDESSDKMKKTPFNRFSVKFHSLDHFFIGVTLTRVTFSFIYMVWLNF